MFEIQKHCIIKGFLAPQWKKVPIPLSVLQQLEMLKDRKDQIGAYNTLANLEAQRTKVPHRVIEVSGK